MDMSFYVTLIPMTFLCRYEEVENKKEEIEREEENFSKEISMREKKIIYSEVMRSYDAFKICIFP